MKPELTLHQRTLTLTRFPVRKNETLQAWDAADEYLINHCHAMALDPQRPILIINDNFGALSCWFANQAPVTTVTDSFITQQAITNNLNENNLPAITILDCLADLPTNPQLVLVKQPKNNRLLSWQLQQLCHLLPQDCVVITAGKVKDIHSSTLKLFEKYLGQTKTSLAVKKARLIFTTVNKSLAAPMPQPTSWTVPEHDLTITNYANVFSSDSLDIGGRFLLDFIPSKPQYKDIIDLGCGNGVIGIKAARLNPHANITCVDESFMAAASCRENAQLNLTSTKNFNVMVANCLDDFNNQSADLVLCNPPFHQNNTITDHIAWQMFCDAQRVLRPQGELIIIGNRQLKYHEKLNRIFDKVDTVGHNDKFVVLRAIK
ncbi:methyltransferase [Photobacterium phosphoreum]|jgi:16S rRNA G1207 methylase RsmC|uniref:Ribosomal RNA large subunit methyltransferase G n=1 Tax=Photobacterium phosphoreum TaxID=659 RepID=A0AAW4ZTP2_PHOPO|nr:methyltransferase [Photobacterium phosphoreum]KJF85494.1 50S rRNA methyltransferase [Photobacterium phosphoreum]MCD9473200.1 methyltransferase [Photobacterium phosphoreum]MCD9478274.1 methyltransferase [Photobacterium phosphoreum]MCD9482298.1 methyltransferase [Photobacterium phosphoreum]MCD9489238.1 methyltransferase [Photobacterium phosphoreum]